MPSLSAPQDLVLARLLGLPPVDGHIPLVAWRRWLMSGLVDNTPAAVLTLCHWQVSTQHISLLPPHLLKLTQEENQALIATLSDFFSDDGLTLTATAVPGRWFVTGELLRDLPCPSLDRLLADDCDVRTLDRANTPAAWNIRRLQTETQMLLYTHPVNDLRETRNELPVNGFVLNGAGAWQPPTDYSPPRLEHVRTGGKATPPASGTVLLIDSLRDAALNSDWPNWALAWKDIDNTLARPEWEIAARHPDFRLTLCGSTRSQTWRSCQANGLQRLWRKLHPAKATATFAAIREL